MAADIGLTYSMPLEVYLQAAVVSGLLVTNNDRLSSHFLLRKEEQMFSLRNATLESFERKPINVDSAEYVIYMDEVYLIADLSPQEQGRRTGIENFYVQKESREVLINLGPYLLQGTIHLFPGSAMYDLLLEKSLFFPVTDALLADRANIGPRTFLVNRSKIGFMTVTSDGLVEL